MLTFRRYWSVIVKNRSFDCSSPAHSYSNHMTFSNASRKTFSSNKDVGSNSSNATTSLFGGGLQKTFATGYVNFINFNLLIYTKYI